jgi:hypothetical protein
LSNIDETALQVGSLEGDSQGDIYEKLSQFTASSAERAPNRKANPFDQ